jgi:hypothetical protein
VLAPAQLACDELDAEEQRSQSGDGAEHTECQGLGTYRLIGCGLELRRDLEVGEVLLGRIPPPLHGPHVGRTVAELHPEVHDAGVAGHRSCERRRRHDVRGEFGDLVLHHLPVQQADADDLEPDAPDGPRTGG